MPVMLRELMGDKSPKSTNKQNAQKQAKANASNQKKKQKLIGKILLV